MRFKEEMLAEFLGGETFIQVSGEIDMDKVNSCLGDLGEPLRFEDLSDDLKRFLHEE